MFNARGYAQGSARDAAAQIIAQTVQSDIAEIETPGGTQKYALAGPDQYYYFTARDFAWSAPGLMDMGHSDAVRDTLLLAFSLQRGDGLIPRDILPDRTDVRYIVGSLGIALPYLPPFHGVFVSENDVVTLDTQAIIPWAASEYVLRTHDAKIAQNLFEPAERALQFVEKNYFGDGLVDKQAPFADWEDSIARTGKVAYTNELYVLALRGLADWATFLGKTDRANDYLTRAMQQQVRFHDHFLETDTQGNLRIRNFDGDDHLTFDANIMAVAYGLVSKEESQGIMRTLRDSPLWRPIPGRATYPDFPDSMKSKLPKLIGNGSYHDSQYWMWMTATAAMAERAIGNKEGCNFILDEIATLVVRDGAACEDYWPATVDGVQTLVPFRIPLYHSECPLTWTSGMVRHAFETGCQ